MAVLAKVEVAAASVRTPLVLLARPSFGAVLQPCVVEAKAVGVLVRQALIREHLVEHAGDDRVVQQHLRRPAPVVALVRRQGLGVVLEGELVLADRDQLLLCEQAWQQHPEQRGSWC